MASCSACKKVKSDISGPVVSVLFLFCFWFFFTCLQVLGFKGFFKGLIIREKLEF